MYERRQVTSPVTVDRQTVELQSEEALALEKEVDTFRVKKKERPSRVAP